MPTLSSDQLIGANFSFQHYRFEHVAEILRDFGFREIELWGIGQHLDLFTEDESRLQQVRQVLAANDLTVWCFTPEQVMYPINIASGEATMRRASVARFLRAADICAALGARYLFLTSGRGFEDEPADAAWHRSVESLREITAHAAGQGVRCLLEPLQRVETNVLQDAAGVRRMLDEVGADNLDVVLDTVAMAVAGDTVAGYVSHFGERLAHVQVVDGRPAGHLVWGAGTLPLGEYLEQLAEHGYRGKVTFEPFGDGSYALDPVAAWQRCLDGARPYFHASQVAV